MATVTGFTAERMLEIENSTVVDGEVVGNDLHLLQRDGTPINAGNVRGPQGIQGVPGNDGVGIPPGGTIYQLLTKGSNTVDYNVGWTDPPLRIYPTVAAVKATNDFWPNGIVPDGTLAYAIDEASLLLSKNNVWKYYMKSFPYVSGNTPYLSYSAAMNPASSYSSLQIVGKTAFLNVTPVNDTNFGAGGTVLVATLATGYRPTANITGPCSMSTSTGAVAARYGSNSSDGGINVIWSGSASSAAYLGSVQIPLADLVTA